MSDQEVAIAQDWYRDAIHEENQRRERAYPTVLELGRPVPEL